MYVHFASPSHAMFMELVEHPGGHDGGEFPQYHSFNVDKNGLLYYNTEFPVCPTDAFAGEEQDMYMSISTKVEAVTFLEGELEEVEKHAANLKELIAKFKTGNDFTALFNEEEIEDQYGENDDE